jgi:isopenicillin N synthase-like dioxygenase
MTDSLTNLRLLHYPSQAARRPEPGQPGCGEHTDYGMVTLLAEDSTGGLSVCRRDGRWVAVHADADQLIVNIGDMLAHWTGGRWTSTMHRAGNPENVDRYSIPFFVNPGFHVTVEPLFGDVRADPPVTITAGEYLLSRFDSTHDYRRSGERRRA